jgi:hypothetical protein
VRLDNAVAHGKGDDLGAVLNVEFVQDVAEVIFDGVFGDALHQQVQDFVLPLG